MLALPPPPQMQHEPAAARVESAAASVPAGDVFAGGRRVRTLAQADGVCESVEGVVIGWYTHTHEVIVRFADSELRLPGAILEPL